METGTYELDLGEVIPEFDEEYWQALLGDPHEPEEVDDGPHYLLEGEELILVRKEAACQNLR